MYIHTLFDTFQPSLTLLHRVSLVPSTCNAIQLLRSFLGRETTTEGGIKWRGALEDAVGEVNLLDLNYALYRCDQEERDDGHGGGAYVVPGAGAFVYCGIEGIMSMLTAVRDNNDLGHPLCDNLRSGDWLAGYTVNRLRLRGGTKKVRHPLNNLFHVHVLHVRVHVCTYTCTCRRYSITYMYMHVLYMYMYMYM